MKTPVQTPGFVERIQAGPAFLLLGQRYLALESGTDPLLSEIVRRYTPTANDKSSYFILFDSAAPEAGDAAWAWIDERCKRISAPQWLETVSDFAWSGVYTSAIDSQLPPRSVKNGATFSQSSMKDTSPTILETRAFFILLISLGQ